MELGEKLREFRISHSGMTLKDVSISTGLSISFLSDIERGRTKPSLDTIYKLANCYKVDPSDLLPEITDNRNIPEGLKQLIQKEKMSNEMVDLMMQIEFRSEKKYKTQQDWTQLYYSLKTILGK